jgi:predicted TIM-barrel fold metal-dependent hydrolase
MPVIDADCHVIETDKTWSYLDAADGGFRPQPYTSEKEPDQPYWVIDGKPRRRPFGTTSSGSTAEMLSGFAQTSLATRAMDDVDARLAHMDALGVDVQVLYPTVYLTQISSRPDEELALAKSYNRWLADIWRQGNGRLRWVAVPPLMTMEEVPDQLRFAKENGAVGIFMRGFEGDRIISDPYFYPLYEEASSLGLAITVHAGCGNPAFADLTTGEAFPRNKLPVISAFHALAFNGVPARFPGLRFGFIEVAAQWLPYLATDLQRRMQRAGREPVDDILSANNMYVAIQTNDDLPNILSYVSEDHLVIGSDYGHSDTSTELEALRELSTQGAVDQRIIDKILTANPTRLYGL